MSFREVDNDIIVSIFNFVNYMAIITGGINDYHVTDEDILNAFSIEPDTDSIDYIYLIRDILEELQTEYERITFLMILFEFKGTEIATMLNISKQQVYKKHMPNIKKTVEKVQNSYV